MRNILHENEALYTNLFIRAKIKMDRQIINLYLNNFRRLFSRYLKSNVGIQTTTYPFWEGAIMIIELGFGIPTKEEIRSNSNDLQEAMRRTNLFEHPDASQEIPGTTIVLSANKIVILKTSDEAQWTEDAIAEDIDKIIVSIKKRRQNHGREN